MQTNNTIVFGRFCFDPVLLVLMRDAGPWWPTLPLRRRLEREIDRLIALLDAVDGDPDLEPSFGCLNDLEFDPCDHGEDQRCSPHTLNPPPVRTKFVRR